jgi:hypothetical protein
MLDVNTIQYFKECAGIHQNPDQEGINLFAELIYRECMKDKLPTFPSEVKFLNTGD